MKSYKYEIKATKNESFEKCKILSAFEAWEYAKKFYHEDIALYESMFMIMMNQSNNVIGWMKVAQGGVSQTVCDPKIVCKAAIDTLATQIILVHNHPSGETKPSRTDIKLTERMKNTLELIDVCLRDHIIISEDRYTSMHEDNMI